MSEIRQDIIRKLQNFTKELYEVDPCGFNKFKTVECELSLKENEDEKR